LDWVVWYVGRIGLGRLVLGGGFVRGRSVLEKVVLGIIQDS